jgi:hypothetical protein
MMEIRLTFVPRVEVFDNLILAHISLSLALFTNNYDSL